MQKMGIQELGTKFSSTYWKKKQLSAEVGLLTADWKTTERTNNLYFTTGKNCGVYTKLTPSPALTQGVLKEMFMAITDLAAFPDHDETSAYKKHRLLAVMQPVPKMALDKTMIY